LTWPGVRTLLIARAVERLYIDCILQKDLLDWVEQGRCVQAAWRAYLTALSSVVRPPAGAALAVQVRTMLAVWKAIHMGVQRYSALVQGIEPLVECTGFFTVAIQGRKLWRQYLRHRFRFELRSGVWLPGARQPRNGHEGAYLTCATQMYDFYTRIFLAGIDAVDPARRDDPALFTYAADAMRAALGELPAVVARDLHSPYAFQGEMAALSLGGYARPHIRLFPSVRRALGDTGEPRTVLLERLPGYIAEASRGGARDICELLESVGRLFNQTRRTQAKRSLHHAPEPVLEALEGHRQKKQHAPSALEEWYAQQEALQRLDALILHAGLSPRQIEILSLVRAGLSHSDIAFQIGINRGTVKQHIHRAQAKLRKAARL
jgi:RNA polymerase sigma factor (sigma-70 family)